MNRRNIGKLDTAEKCREECAKVYRLASNGKIPWQEAQEAAALLTQLFNMMNGGNEKQTEVNWGDVGKNALRG